MRYALLITCLLALACTLGKEQTDEACEAYLDCLADGDAAAFTAASPVYGRGGSCWDGDADDCIRACQSGLDAAAAAYPEESSCAVELDDDGPFSPTPGNYRLVLADEHVCGWLDGEYHVSIEVPTEGRFDILWGSGRRTRCTLTVRAFTCEPYEWSTYYDAGAERYVGEWDSTTALHGTYSRSITDCNDSGDCGCDDTTDYTAERE